MATNSKVVTNSRKPPAAGKGRPKGSQNKNTKAVKDMILGALNKAGGEAYLVRMAHQEPKAFLTLVGKVMPIQLSGDPDGDPIRTVTRIELCAVTPDVHG